MADYKTLSDAEFRALAESWRESGRRETSVLPSAPAPTDDLSRQAPDLLPETRQALIEESNTLARRVDPKMLSGPAREMGMRPGVQLDIGSGVPFGSQLSQAFNRAKREKFIQLQKTFGQGNVDIAPDGNFVLRNQIDAETGIRKDILVNPPGLGMDDLADLVGMVPELAGGVVGTIAGSRVPGGRFLKATGGLVGMALTGQSAGASKDIAVRYFQGNSVDLPEITKERAKDAAFDFAFGAALGTATKVGTKLISPFARGGAAQAEELAAVKALEKSAGEKMPRTPGERTGSPLLLRAEAQFAKRPGSSMAFEKMAAERDSFVRRMQNRFLKIPAETAPKEVAELLPSAERTGQKALGQLGSIGLQAESQVARAAQAVEKVGTDEAERLAGISLSRPLDTTKLGGLTRQSVVGQFDKFRSEMGKRYDDFLSKPEVSDQLVSASGLASDARAMIKKLPFVVQDKAVPTGLLDEFGRDLTITKQVRETLSRFVPPKALSAIEELASLKGGETTVASLKQIRTSIDDAIAEGISIPGTDTKLLTNLRSTVTDRIEDALSKVGGQPLKDEWIKLNKDYASGISRFDKTSIREILVKPGESGAIGETALVERIFGGSAGAKDVYAQYKEFFGAGSPEFSSLQRAIREDVIGTVKPGTGVIDGRKLLTKLDAMRNDVAADVFGLNQTELRKVSEALGAAQGKLDVDALTELATNKTLTATKLVDLISAERKQAELYKNRILAAASKGALGKEPIQPSEFVRYMENVAEPSEVRQVLSRLQDDPELLQSIRTLAAEDFLTSASAGERFSGKLKPSKIASTFGTRTQEDKWEALLGDDTYRALKNFAIALRPTEAATETFKSTGGIQAGQEVSQLFGKGELSALPAIALRAFGAFVYAGPGRILANTLIEPGQAHRFVNGVVASTPFLEYLYERYEAPVAESIVDSLGAVVDDAYLRESKLKGETPMAPGETFDLKKLSDEEMRMFLERSKR